MRREFQVFLTEVATGEPVDAKLIVNLTMDEVDEAVALWTPHMTAQTNAGRRPPHAHWRWSDKARAAKGLLSYAILGIEAGGEIQGMMLWNDDVEKAKSPLELGKGLVYISILATAPWNDSDIVVTPRFRGAGSLLLNAAVEHSADLGYKGRIGLHSLPKAEPFYRDKLGMLDLGIDQGHEGLRYFEFTPDLAQKFLNKTGGQS